MLRLLQGRSPAAAQFIQRELCYCAADPGTVVKSELALRAESGSAAASCSCLLAAGIHAGKYVRCTRYGQGACEEGGRAPLFRSTLYGSVAFYGAALVCFLRILVNTCSLDTSTTMESSRPTEDPPGSEPANLQSELVIDLIDLRLRPVLTRTRRYSVPCSCFSRKIHFS